MTKRRKYNQFQSPYKKIRRRRLFPIRISDCKKGSLHPIFVFNLKCQGCWRERTMIREVSLSHLLCRLKYRERQFESQSLDSFLINSDHLNLFQQEFFCFATFFLGLGNLQFCVSLHIAILHVGFCLHLLQLVLEVSNIFIPIL